LQDNKNTFITELSEYFENNIISKLTISFKNQIIIENTIIIKNNIISENNIIPEKNINTENNIITEKINYSEINIIFVKVILSKNEKKLSFNFRFPTKDITKNYNKTDGIALIEQLIGTQFLQADLYLTTASVHLIYDKKGKSKLIKKQIEHSRTVNTEHNKQKNRILEEGSADFLKLLGVFTEDGKLKNDKRDKFKQINKYLEFFAQAIKESKLTDNFSIADMGAGKGYLTFAMYHYVTEILGKNGKILGVEFREDMVNLCNHLAAKANFSNLSFEQGTIENSKLSGQNVMIALHACDTATDEAIFRGITEGVEIIMLSPCCHKQIRKQIKPKAELGALSRFGIIEERQAEIVTDVIRTLILEAYGYQTKIFEFIDSDHTPKNLMITAIKTEKNDVLFKNKLKEIKDIKTEFGIEFHYLEKLMKI
jgi:SAM-dependent methyltransferase